MSATSLGISIFQKTSAMPKQEPNIILSKHEPQRLERGVLRCR